MSIQPPFQSHVAAWLAGEHGAQLRLAKEDHGVGFVAGRDLLAETVTSTEVGEFSGKAREIVERLDDGDTTDVIIYLATMAANGIKEMAKARATAASTVLLEIRRTAGDTDD
jgi:hypothetical protein